MVCDNGTFVNLQRFKCPYPRCFRCDCHPLCSLLDTCCPRGSLQTDGTFLRHKREPSSPSPIPSLYPEQIECAPIPFNSYGHLQVVSCPPGFKDVAPKGSLKSQTLELCARDQDNAPDLRSFLSYIDIQSGLIFKNRFCAICNGYKVYDNTTFSMSATGMGVPKIKIAVPWPIHVICLNYQELYTLTSSLAFMKAAHKKLRTSVCNVFYRKPPSELEPRWCFRNALQDYKNSYTCDEPLYSLCRDLNHTYLSLTRHKSLFCAICDGIRPVLLPHQHCSRAHRLWYIDKGNETPPPPLSLVVDAYVNKGIGSERQKYCSSNSEWIDEKGECQPALCPPGKLPVESGQCLSAIDQIRGLGYQVYLVFRPEKKVNLSTEEVQSLIDDIGTGILDIAREGYLNVNVSMGIDMGNSCSSARLEQISLSAYLVGIDSLNRDEYEKDLLEHLTKDWSVVMEQTNTNFTLKNAMLGVGFRSVLQKNITNEECLISLPKKYIENDHYNTDTYTAYAVHSVTEPNEIVLSVLCDRYISDVCLNKQKRTVYSKLFSSIPPMSEPDPIWMFEKEFIDATHNLACPYISMNISNTRFGGDFVEVSFSYMGYNFSTKSTARIAVVNHEIRICIDVFKNITGHIIIETNQSTLERIRYYLEVICILLSIVCLSFSTITYCLFRSLRSLPGLNNLSLCVCLLIAQVCLLITTRWGVEGKLPRGYCLAHAVLLHGSWLAAFAWMSICCIHMFRVFSTHDNRFLDSRSDGKRYRVYCLYGYGLPALIVIATYVINTGVSKGHRIGYDDKVCFLNTRHSVWTFVLALLTPLCLVILTNGAMFALTVREIASVSQVQDNRRDSQRQGVITYVKLSTLTGLLGAVTVLAIQLDNEVLSLLTSPLMALQGVFIFISFLCNNKVRLLYIDLLQRCGIPCQSKAANETSTNPTQSTRYSASRSLTTSMATCNKTGSTSV
ncbi:adhesion G protein-coupled receptor L3 [Elysia marginata]|uniref:Adhesion G protein-coupled receptor L3 n=1 Tax=Elysia marginata TaxID=1093978 RepID=A0AAV4EZN3_9GAST|nr:adhesion G protein-coupled receptor L3 [Elysia marginata]